MTNNIPISFEATKEESILESEINEKGKLTFTESAIYLGLGDSHITYMKSENISGNIPESLIIENFEELVHFKTYENDFIHSISISLGTASGSYNTFGMSDFNLLDKNGNSLGAASNITFKTKNTSGIIDIDVEYSSLNTIMNFKTTTGGAYSSSYYPYIFGKSNTQYGWLGKTNVLASNARVNIEITFSTPDERIRGISFVNHSNNSSFGRQKINNITLYQQDKKIIGYNYKQISASGTQKCQIGDFIDA